MFRLESKGLMPEFLGEGEEKARQLDWDLTHTLCDG